MESVSQFGNYKDTINESDSEEDGDSGLYTTTEKPLKKGRQLVKSGFVADTKDNKNEQHYFLRAHVHHSMTLDYPDHWTFLSFLVMLAVML